MMGIEFKELFLSMVIYALGLISMSKISILFFQKKNNIAGKCICFWGLLVVSGILTGGNYLISAVIKQALLMLFLFMAFCGDKWEKIGFASIFVSVWEFIRESVSSVLSICDIVLSNNKFMPYVRGNGTAISILSFLITIVFMYVLFGRTKLSYRGFLYGGGKLLCSSTILLLILDVCNYGISQGVTMVSNANGAEYWNTTYNEFFTHIEVFIISTLCMIICFSLLFGLNRLIEYMTVDNLHKMEISRYQSILEQYREQTNVRHDMKNHIISLSALAEQEEWGRLREYLSKVYNAGMIGGENIETGNNVVNAIVNTKRQSAEHKNIDFKCDINISKPLAIDEYDLCIIWGNILDNAIEAAGIVKQERYIFVRSEIVKKNLVISIKNTIEPGILPEKFGVQNFGTGLINVRKIVEKVNGVMRIEIKDNVFEISIMLPIVS